MKVILNILTHGDEKIGLKVAKEINKLKISKKCLVIQIANIKAFKAHKRFIDQDLNRSFPGKKNGNYEERLAYKLSPSIKKADIVIDIHSTTSNLKDAVIITKFNDKTLKYVDTIQPRYVLVMTATKDSALMSQAKVGIAFEFGKDSSPIAVKNTVLGVKSILAQAGLLHLNISRNKRVVATEYYEVIKTVPKPKGYSLVKGIKNYQMIKKGTAYAFCGDNKIIAKENFYPILFGEKKYKYYFGFSGKKLKRQ
jgi:succinylglutamate desuccinylase